MTRFPYNKPSQATIQKLVVPASLPSRQSGISLIEAMISLLLIAVTAVGLAYVSSRSMLTQRYVTTQNLAVIQMREQIKTTDTDSSDLKVSLGSNQFSTVSYNKSGAGSGSADFSIDSISDSNIQVINPIFERTISTTSDTLFGGKVSIGQ